MNQKQLEFTTLLITAVVAGSTTLLAAEPTVAAKDEGPLPQTLTVKCSVDAAYAFKPNRKSWHIDQLRTGLVKSDLVLERHDRRMPFGGGIPGWKGSKTIVVKGGYTLRIDAHYLIRKPMSDFVGKPSGLTLDVSYFYKEKLIGYASAASWSEEKEISVSASATDTAYMALMNDNGFGIPSQFAGYSNGFRYWAAVRDGLNGREGGLTFESLSAALKPLGRDGNIMMPNVTVSSTVSRPTGSDIPAADLPRQRGR